MAKHRLTIGMRARILTLQEKPKKNRHDASFWCEEYGGRDVLLTERNSSGSFAAMVLGKGVTKLEKEKTGIVANEVAWVDEDDLILVGRDFDANLDFIDWYKEHEYDFCPDCLAWRPENEFDEQCPNEKCPGRLYDERRGEKCTN